MTTPAYPNQIRMSQIRAEVKNPTTNQDLSLGGYRAGEGKVVVGAIGYPEGLRTEIPSSGAISMGNFHSFTNFSNQTSEQILQHVWSNLPNYFRYQMFAADSLTMPYPAWRGDAGLAWSGAMNDVRETNSVGELSQGIMNLYFDGTAGSRNNNDGSLPTLSEWTTYVSFSCGWSPVFNNRTTPSVKVYKNVGGVDTLVDLYRLAGYWSNDNADPNRYEPGGLAGAVDCLGWHMNIYWIPEKLTVIKRATQDVEAGNGSNRPSSHGAILLPGKWEAINVDKMGSYETVNQTCRVYRDDNTSLPFRIQTYSGTTPVGHRLDEFGDDVFLISSQRRFAKWRFLNTNTTTMAPILNTKEYIVEPIDDTQFYIRDPASGDYVYPTVSYPVGNANRNATTTVTGGIGRKRVSIPPGCLQFFMRQRKANQNRDVYEFNTPFLNGYLSTNQDWNKNGPGTAGWHPEEIGDAGTERKIINIMRGDDGDGNAMKMMFNTSNRDVVNTWKSTTGVTRFFFQTGSTNERLLTRLNLKLNSLF